MIRRCLLLVLAVGAGAAFADEPAGPPSSCQNDLLTTGEYAALIRAQRDAYEVEIARLRAHVNVLEAEAARVKAAAPAAVPAP